MKKIILFGLLILSIFTGINKSFAQAYIPGKYLLVKHTYTEKGKTDDLLTKEYIYSLELTKDHQYKLTYDDRHNGYLTVLDGKWKLINKGKTLLLYDGENAQDKEHDIADKKWPIVRSTAKELVIKELLFGMDLLGTSYYQRQK